MLYIQISIVIDEFDPQNMQEILSNTVKRMLLARQLKIVICPNMCRPIRSRDLKADVHMQRYLQLQ